MCRSEFRSRVLLLTVTDADYHWQDMTDPHELRLTASVVVHRTPVRQFQAVLASLQADGVTSVCIIDNSPDDRLRAVVEACAGVCYLRVPNRGYGAAHNVALRRALASGSTHHLLLNPDVRWDPGVIAGLLEAMRRTPRCGMAAPRILYPDGRLQHTCRMLPAPADLILRRFVPSFLWRRRRQRYLLAHWDHASDLDVPYLQGSFMLVACDALREAGLFDERFFMYPEDIDLTRRIHALRPTLYCPAVTVIHDHAAASARSLRMLAIHVVNMVRYFNKWGWVADSARRQANDRLLEAIDGLSAPCRELSPRGCRAAGGDDAPAIPS